MTEFADLLGKTIVEIQGLEKGSNDVFIRTSEDKQYRMNHHQDCCESVSVEDVEGDITDLIGLPLLVAEEAVNGSGDDSNLIKTMALIGALPDISGDSFTWTFYRLATAKGYVVIRWLGESNGYYSEGVSFEEV